MPFLRPDTVCGDERADRPLLHRRAGQPRRAAHAGRHAGRAPGAACRPPRASSAPTGSTWAPRCCCSTRRAPPATGAVLDLGCGWGPIALALGLLSPRRLGVGGGRQPAGAGPGPAQRRRPGTGGLPRRARPQDVPEDLRFAAIWSNPPIRVGKAVLHDMLLPGCRAWPTAARHTWSCRRTWARTRCSGGWTRNWPGGSPASSRSPVTRARAPSGCSQCCEAVHDHR